MPFKHNQTKSKHSFGLVHFDVWGPFKHVTIYRQRYFLTVVDDFSRFTWLLKNKSEVRFLAQNICAYVSTQFFTQIKTIKSDNGSEFYMPDFCASKGTIHQTLCVQTPQQNGIVERKHQHIMNIGRALRFQSNIPIAYWGFCVTILHTG